jgi:hypothetical protein
LEGQTDALDILNIAYSKRPKESRKNSLPWPGTLAPSGRQEKFRGMALKVPILLQRDGRGFISFFWGIFAGSKRQCLPKGVENGFGGGFFYL